jgi:hypothetical protein
MYEIRASLCVFLLVFCWLVFFLLLCVVVFCCCFVVLLLVVANNKLRVSRIHHHLIK